MCESSGDVLINFQRLEMYLSSPYSIFEVETIQEFLESLHIVGFSRAIKKEPYAPQHLIYRFSNPKFNVEKPATDLYKHTVTASKGYKRMTAADAGWRLIQRLLRKQQSLKTGLKITSLDLSRMKLVFALQKQLDMMRNEHLRPTIVDIKDEDPAYVTNNKIAGYYGNVSLQALEQGFQNYFPIFEEDEPKEDIEVDVETVPSMESLEQQFAAVEPMDFETLPMPIMKTPKKRQTMKARNLIKETKAALKFLIEEAQANEAQANEE